MISTLEIKPSKHQAEPGKYLTFMVATEFFSIPILTVREVIRSTTVTPVPHVPAHVRGVIHLRGRMVPVVDLRLKFGLRSTGAADGAFIVVVELKVAAGRSLQLGLVVDAVDEVRNMTPADLEAAPDFGAPSETERLFGVAKRKGAVILLLDFDKLLLDSATAKLAGR